MICLEISKSTKSKYFKNSKDLNMTDFNLEKLYKDYSEKNKLK